MKAYIRKHKNWLQPVLALLGGTIIIAIVVSVHAAQAPKPVVATPMATTTPAGPDAFSSVRIIGQAAVVYDLKTGHVLYSENGDAQLPLASLTKLLTTYAAVIALPQKASVVITQSALDQEGESGFTIGESFALDDLARLALVASSNDAAEAIAEAAESKRSMTGRQLLANAAATAGLEHTYALNGTGLDENATQAGAYGSARDIAILAGALLQKAPRIAQATAEPSITIRSLEGVSHTLPNTNQDAVHVPGILLSKTGYTDLAGGNLVVVFDTAIGHPVAVVVLGSTRDGRFTDVERLVRATLAHFAGTAT